MVKIVINKNEKNGKEYFAKGSQPSHSWSHSSPAVDVVKEKYNLVTIDVLIEGMENVAVIGVTKIASVKVIMLSCAMTILLAFLSPIMCVVETIPACVTGGVSLLLYGFIAGSGVKMLISQKQTATLQKQLSSPRRST